LRYELTLTYFGRKAHFGVDRRSKLIHAVVATAANVHDSTVLGDLLHGEETDVWGDSAYQGQGDTNKTHVPNARGRTNRRAKCKGVVNWCAIAGLRRTPIGCLRQAGCQISTFFENGCAPHRTGAPEIREMVEIPTKTKVRHKTLSRLEKLSNRKAVDQRFLNSYAPSPSNGNTIHYITA
jgi:IS5 family transposase